MPTRFQDTGVVGGPVNEERSSEGTHPPRGRLLESILRSFSFLWGSRNRDGDSAPHENVQNSSESAHASIRELVISAFNILSESIKNTKKAVSEEDLEKVPVVKCGPEEKGRCPICLSDFCRKML